MDFNKYKTSFIPKAKDAGYTDTEIENLLQYAEHLYSNNVPIIYDQEHLAALLGVRLEHLLSMTNTNRKFYKVFKLPKKKKGFRKIEQPLPTLLSIQYWILDNILVKCSNMFISSSATAFVPGVQLRENLMPHKDQDIVVAVDIKDFFTSVGFGPVYNIFDALGYDTAVSVMLTKLCLYHGFLPQGAPTSPMLSNMVFFELDQRIEKYCHHRDYKYTRYADDLTFSGSDVRVGLLLRYVRWMLGLKGFELNESKTKIMGRANAQYVTGCTVNERPNAPRSYRNKIRQEIFHLKTKGLEHHFAKVKNLPPHINTLGAYLNHLLGKVYYVLQINPDENEFIEYHDYLKKMIQEKNSQYHNGKE